MERSPRRSIPLIVHVPHVSTSVDALEGNRSSIVDVQMAGKKHSIIFNQEKTQFMERERPHKVIKDTKFSGALSNLQSCDLIEAEGDIVSQSMLGCDLESITVPSETVSVLDTIVRLVVTRTLSPIPYWRIPIGGQYLDNGGPIVAKKAVVICMQVLAESASSLQSSNNFLATKLQKKMGKNPNQFREFVGDMITMFLAGTETSATTILSCIYQFAQDKFLRDGLRIETEALGEDIESIDVTAIPSKLPLLTSLIFEVLRHLESSVPMYLDNVKIPAQSSLFVTNRIESKKSYAPLSGPRDKFCAKKYLMQNDSGKDDLSDLGHIPTPSTGFQSFGLGARICPGRHFFIRFAYFLLLLSLLLALYAQAKMIEYITEAHNTYKAILISKELSSSISCKVSCHCPPLSI
ncbi:hypothetical protein CTEN210_14814 [Chaetoceros tenuissimus]|uniref:Cytochrome P450 n=1 Tax=Chaetoceros tenuissimus TaxID=426638 RepID=A0AAD3HCS0_9STRA|nr:hypothetical protein CTEN210_14814 [Chaetoceros tenuissimus]